MVKKKATQDPHADREAAKYDSPIPSREFILKLLGDSEQPLTGSQIADALEIFDDEGAEALRRRLIAMERDGQLLNNRRGAYGPIDKLDLIRGRVQGHRDGFGFLMPTDGSDDLYLSARQMALVFDGDEALCRVSGTDRRGRRAGITSITIRAGTSAGAEAGPACTSATADAGSAELGRRIDQ